MSLTDANWAPEAAAMLHGGRKISKERKAELKALFIEGLVRFLDIYAQTEIGEGIEIDITKIALHINAPTFENDDLYMLHTIDDVYKLCEELTLAGLPLWRFLKLSEYQSHIFESGYDELLISLKKSSMKERPCFGCIWYKNTETFLGQLEECCKPETEISMKRRGCFDPTKISKCKWLTTLKDVPKAAYNLPENNFAQKRRKDNFFERIEPERKRFVEELKKDPFRIPKNLTDEEAVDLETEYEPLSDLALAFGNKRGKRERQGELRRAAYIEGMVRFFEQYAKCELGSSYIANIKNIALYVSNLSDYELSHIKSMEDMYASLEEMVIGETADVREFVKLDEDYEPEHLDYEETKHDDIERS